jgi:hypothetical protein
MRRPFTLPTHHGFVSCRVVATFTIDDARAHIAEVRWQFAKTMPQWPHEYTIRIWRPDREREFDGFVALIRRDGIVKPWPRDAATPRARRPRDLP